MKERLIQLIIAALVSIGGLALLFYGASVDPEGQIHDTILVAFGEAATFAGSIIGIDYHYKFKNHNNDNNTNQKRKSGRESGQRNDFPPLPTRQDT